MGRRGIKKSEKLSRSQLWMLLDGLGLLPSSRAARMQIAWGGRQGGVLRAWAKQPIHGEQRSVVLGSVDLQTVGFDRAWVPRKEGPARVSSIRYIERVIGEWVRRLLLSCSMSDKSVSIADQGAAGWFSVRDRRARAMDGGTESPVGRSPRTPEAEIGHRLEDLWDVQQPQLSPSQKLNSCFEDLPVSSFPAAPPSQGPFLVPIFTACLILVLIL
ncbi:hypothetical protein GW17_00028883 [Ensete ventricosum]|nr:hypothetical protein GW17_00028883 [Ensete ventricosum]